MSQIPCLKDTAEVLSWPSLRVLYFLSETPSEKTKFSAVKWPSIGDSFWIKGGGMSPLLLSAVGPHLVQIRAGPGPAAIASEFTCIALAVFRRLCFFRVLHPL